MSRHYYNYPQRAYYGGRALGEDVVSTTEVTTTTTEDEGTDWVKVGMQAADKLYEWWDSSQDKKAAEEAARKANRARLAAEREQQKADREAQKAAEATRAAEEREGRRRTQKEEDLQVLDVYNKAVAAAKANKMLVGGGLLVVSAALIYVAMRKR